MRSAFAALILLVAPVSAQEFFTLKGHGGPIMDVAVSPSGQIATASFDNAVGLWSGTEPRWRDGHEAAVVTVLFADDDTILSGGDDFRVLLWREDMAEPSEVTKHQNKVTDVAYDAEAKIIATASWDGTLHYLRMPDALRSVGSPSASASKLTLEGHRNGVNAVALAEEGQLYSASSDGTIRVWRVGEEDYSSRPLAKHGFGINKLVLNETDGWLAYGAIDGGTRVIDLDSGDLLADLTLGRRPILSMAFHPDTKQLAVGDGEGYIMVVDTERFRIIKDFKAARNGPIWALAFSQDGQNLHAGGIEDTLYSWPIATMTEHEQMATDTRSFLEDPETLPNGERQFKRKCSICHTLTPGSARRAGPTLFGVFGRQAGTVTDYTYSPTLTGSDIVWNEDTIDQLFDLGPDHYIPGSKMPMQRITGPQDRKDLISFLRQATKPGEN
jgi:cytochrome c